MKNELVARVASLQNLRGWQQVLLAFAPLVLSALLAGFFTWADIESLAAVWVLYFLTGVGALLLGGLSVAAIRKRWPKTHPILLTIAFLLLAVAYSYGAFLAIIATVIAVYY